MPGYDFLNLSPVEFEEFSRDILQEYLMITLESFSNGPDSGIDFRHCSSGQKLIVQCKRYANFDALFANLKKEAKKVQQLLPDSYILTTTASLSPRQKDKILLLFNGFIKAPGDIYAQKDLNNLLARFPHIERRHFKLWLSSITIVEKVLHGKVFTQTHFEKEAILNARKLYVENVSYYESLKILNQYNFVIITGIPGSGKTMLSRILVCNYLDNGFDEFYSISGSISEAYEVYKEGVKQIFLFDDFLGRNFLDQNILTNEEVRIIRFIERVSRSKDKIIILNTREYILAQAKKRYETFNDTVFSKAKYIVDLNQYTYLVRAKILYNHIVNAGLDQKYIDEIVKNHTYFNIIGHQNFNPRIIGLILTNEFLKSISSNDVPKKILEYLDNPYLIWKHPFENDITELSRIMLGGLVTSGDPMFADDLKNFCTEFCRNNADKYRVSYNEIAFRDSLLEMEGTFLQIDRDNNNRVTVSFANPSVTDFLIRYLEEMPGFCKDILSSAIFVNQLFRIFVPFEEDLNNSDIHPIYTTEDLLDCIVDKVANDFDRLEISTLDHSVQKGVFAKIHCSVYTKLDKILSSLLILRSIKLSDFIKDNFYKLLVPEKFDGDDFSSYMILLMIYQGEYKFDWSRLIKLLFKKIRHSDDLVLFSRLEDMMPEEYTRFMKNKQAYLDRVNQILLHDAQTLEDYDLQSFIFRIEYMSKYKGIYNSIAKTIALERSKEKQKSTRKEKRRRQKAEPNHEDDISKYIVSLFESLYIQSR